MSSMSALSLQQNSTSLLIEIENLFHFSPELLPGRVRHSIGKSLVLLAKLLTSLRT